MREDWSTLKKLIWLRRTVGSAAPILKTVKGALLHITDALAKPAHELVAVLKPQQDLHGYDAPWPAGGGVNIWDEQWELGSINVTDGAKTSSTTIIRSKNNIPVVSGRQYCVVDTLSEGIYMLFYDENDAVVQYVKESGDTASVSNSSAFIPDNASRLVTAPQNAVYCLFRIKLTTYTSGIAINYPASVTIYSPYSNECPISGWAGANIEQRGKNLVVPDNPENPMQNYTHTSTGTVLYSSEYDAFYSFGNGIAEDKRGGAYNTLFVAPNDMTVTFSVDTYNIGTNFGLRFYVKGVRVTDIHGATNTWEHYAYTVTLAKGQKLQISYYGNIYWKNLQVVAGTSADQYYPYVANTLPINWQSEAGTIYGGTVTLNEDGSADLVSEKVLIEYDGSSDEAWEYEITADGYKNSYIAAPSAAKKPQVTSAELICSSSPTGARAVDSSYRAIRNQCYISQTNNFNYCWLDTLGISSAAGFKAWLQDGHSIQIVATLTAPATYHFDNIGQLILFLGENNIWVDASDDLTLTYYADGNASDAEALGILLGGMYSPGGDVSDKDALNILLGN